jgi:hypothetical protein
MKNLELEITTQFLPRPHLPVRMLSAMGHFRRVLVLGIAIVAGCAATAEPLLSPSKKDLAAWEFIATPATEISSVCHYTDDGSLAVRGKPVGYLATKKSYDNYRLHVVWRWPADAAKNSNSGVLLHIASGPKDRAWPECFQVQTKPGRAGDLLPMAGATFTEKLSTAPDAKTPQLDHRVENVEKPIGEWNLCDIVCRDGAIEITINGVRQNQITGATPGAGKIGFQLEGTPYELRNIDLTPLE